MAADQPVCSSSGCPHPPSLWGAARLLKLWERVVSALQSKMGAARGHPPSCRDRMDLGSSGARDAALWCGPCLWYCTLLSGQVPPALPEGRGALFSSVFPLIMVHCYQGSCELSWDGQPGCPAMVHPSCRGRRTLSLLPCLRKDPRAPSCPQSPGTNAPPSWGQSWFPCSVHLPVSSMQQELCSLPRYPSFGQRC